MRNAGPDQSGALEEAEEATLHDGDAIASGSWTRRSDRRSRARSSGSTGAAVYPRPVSLRGVRIWVVPWLFRAPWFAASTGTRRGWTILVRSRAQLADEQLVAHELCHVWQMQHRPVPDLPVSYLVRGYAGNRDQREARDASEPKA